MVLRVRRTASSQSGRRGGRHDNPFSRCPAARTQLTGDRHVGFAVLFPDRPMDLTPMRSSLNVRPGICDCHCLGNNGADVPLFRHRQLVINTGTTIITFLMVFLIQNTQNRDSAAVSLSWTSLSVLVQMLAINS